MPLPDERPRKTVANLIGQFEKQKAASSTPTIPIIPRTSSVASHRTGDSVIEEMKDRREWPPKPVPAPLIDLASDVSPTPDPPKSSTTDASPVSSPPDNTVDFSPPVQITPPTPATPTPLTSVVDQTLPVASKPKSEATAKVNPPKSAAASNSVSASHRTSIIKPHPTKVAPASVKPSGRTSVSTPTKTPLKSVVTPRNPASSPLVSTPIRTKSPSEVSTKTPLTRPKTPSHLYTPTAASLARSRNAPPPPPVEKPKRKLTTDLTKPTAASASKMRSVVTPTPVSRSPHAAVTKSTIKSSTPSSKVITKNQSEVNTPLRSSIQNPGQTTTSTAAHNQEKTDVTQTPHEIHEPREVETTHDQVGGEDLHEHQPAGRQVIENYDDDVVESQRLAEESNPESVRESPSGTQVLAEVDHTSDTDSIARDLSWSPSQGPQMVEPVAASEMKPSPGAGTELENPVNIPQTVPTVPDAATGEIPDEH